jgi:hypothetical protein
LASLGALVAFFPESVEEEGDPSLAAVDANAYLERSGGGSGERESDRRRNRGVEGWGGVAAVGAGEKGLEGGGQGQEGGAAGDDGAEAEQEEALMDSLIMQGLEARTGARVAERARWMEGGREGGKERKTEGLGREGSGRGERGGGGEAGREGGETSAEERKADHPSGRAADRDTPCPRSTLRHTPCSTSAGDDPAAALFSNNSLSAHVAAEIGELAALQKAHFRVAQRLWMR